MSTVSNNNRILYFIHENIRFKISNALTVYTIYWYPWVWFFFFMKISLVTWSKLCEKKSASINANWNLMNWFLTIITGYYCCVFSIAIMNIVKCHFKYFPSNFTTNRMKFNFNSRWVIRPRKRSIIIGVDLYIARNKFDGPWTRSVIRNSNTCEISAIALLTIECTRIFH